MTTTKKANLGSGKQGGNPILSCERRKERGEHRQWHSWSETLGAYQAWAPQQVVRVRSSSTAPLNPLSARLLFLPLTPRCDEVITQRSPALWPLQKTLRHLSNAHLSAWKACNLPTNISTPHGKKERKTLAYSLKRKNNSKPHRNLSWIWRKSLTICTITIKRGVQRGQWLRKMWNKATKIEI